MQRIMIVGQPGAGKSTLAREMGRRTGLPVVHIDHIHWMSGWVERPAAEKARLCAEAEARDEWIFEGGFSPSWPNRIARADLLVWLDLPLPLRLWRVVRRTWRNKGQTRPDLPDGCPETFGADFPAFLRFIWRTRRSGRAKMAALAAAAPVPVVHLRSRRAVREYLSRT